MRKDTSLELTAAEVVNHYTEAQLTSIFREYGEVRNPEKLAKKIIERRLFSPVETTRHLREIVEQLDGSRLKKGRVHPAARVFQALRIFVNKELEGVDRFLEKLPDFLNKGARIAYLTYHSIEDRIVKRSLKSLQERGRVRILKPFPMFPRPEEILENLASRSAKLRAAEIL
jgi:16S rRNA (cytosine1402-N4)-methyltransferase